MDDAIDHISNLPNCLLTHILTFLTTKEVVQTCTLSTRWKNLWAFVPVLNFDFAEFVADCDFAEPPEHEAKFMRFVNGVLKNREVPELQTFQLMYHDHPSSSDEFAECLLRAIEFRPRVIFIQIRRLFLSESDSIWTSLFTCTSLEKMDLLLSDNIYVYFEHIRPKSVHLPFLKALKLSNVINEDDDSFVKKLFTGCPLLEDLVLTRCRLGFSEIASKKLKKLVIARATTKGIQICCPSLVFLVIKTVRTDEISLKNMSSLVDAEITDIRFDSTNPAKLNILSGLSCATSLKLFSYISQVKGLLAKDISNCKNFSNLESLELGCSNEGFDLVACFIHNSPNLHKLTLYLTEPDEDGVDEEAVQGSRDIPHQHEYLKMVKIINWSNDASVDKLVEFLHAHVKTIEELIVSDM